MFGKKKNTKNSNESLDKKPKLQIETMPPVFYGGKNPNIYEPKDPVKKKSQPESGLEKPKIETPPLIQPSAAKTSSVTKVSPDKVYSSPKKKGNKVILIFLVAIILLAGVSWYVISDTLKNTQGSSPAVVSTTDSENNNDSAQQPSAIQQVPDTTQVIIPTATTPLDSNNMPSATAPLNFPRTIFSTAVDMDNDDLTDVEEELFGTDSGTWDSDGDGYYDGQEVANLYNPRGFSPSRLIDSGLVRDYINPALQYRVYYPTEWDVAAVDPQSTQVLFSAITGDYIEIRSFEKPTAQNFSAWFARTASGQRFSDLEKKINRFQIEGYLRRDGLVGYIEAESYVFVIIYHPGTEQQIAYPNVMNMFFQSFRPSRISLPLPEQVVIPTSSVTSTMQSSSTIETEIVSSTTSTL